MGATSLFKWTISFKNPTSSADPMNPIKPLKLVAVAIGFDPSSVVVVGGGGGGSSWVHPQEAVDQGETDPMVMWITDPSAVEIKDSVSPALTTVTSVTVNGGDVSGPAGPQFFKPESVDILNFDERKRHSSSPAPNPSIFSQHHHQIHHQITFDNRRTNKRPTTTTSRGSNNDEGMLYFSSAPTQPKFSGVVTAATVGDDANSDHSDLEASIHREEGGGGEDATEEGGGEGRRRTEPRRGSGRRGMQMRREEEGR